LWDALPTSIILIINAVKDFTSNSLKRINNKSSQVKNTWIQLKSYGIDTFINEQEYYIIVHFIIKNMDNREQCLCYALLNFVCNIYNEGVYECTINHLINCKDDDRYIKIIKKLSADNFNLDILIDNCYNGTNESIYQEIMNL